MSPFTRPELVIRRADELLSVDQPLAALSSISEVFSSKRFRTTPLSTLEPILIKFLGLCVDLRKGRTAKEGLHMYKNVAQNTSVGSVEVVIKEFLEKSKLKLEQALRKVDEVEGVEGAATDKVVKGANGEVLPDKEATEDEKKEAEIVSGEVEDLEASETPESILLSSVSEEKSRDRTYRTLVTPWLRFLWEAYRTALDILRNNARLEVLYQTVSHEAFAFCLAHQRKTEFRRLSETLRSHVTSSQKYSNQSHSINLSDPDTLQRHLDTRFQQLNTAVELELWQESFRTAEDIHGLVGMSKRAPKASMMASFYEKMVKVFGVGQNYLFHAAAYGKLYSLHAVRAAVAQQNENKAEDSELEKLSSLVLLSALAVPLGSGVLGEGGKRRDGGVGEEGEAKGKLGRLAALLGLPSTPTRAGLITDALNRHVLKRVSPELCELYNILEVDFHPLSITSKIEPILAALESRPETARYVEPLKDVVLARLFQQLAQVYQSLKIERVVKLASFDKETDQELTRRRVEKFVTEACRRGDLDVVIDHASGCLKFQEDLFGSEAASHTGPVASTSSQQYDGVKTLQPSAATLLRTHLSRLASTLYAALDLVNPDNSPIAAAIASRALAFAAVEKHGSEERGGLIGRTQIIKRRKELADEQTARKEKEEAHQRTVRAQQKAEEDAKKQRDDLKKRELERIQKEVAAVKKEEALKLAQALAVRAGLKVDLKEAANMDSQALVAMQVTQIEKDKRELAQKLSSVSKRIDHVERAFRKEEVALLVKDYDRQQKRDQEAYVTAQKLRVETLRKQHAEDLEIRDRIKRIMPDYATFKTKMEAESRAAYSKEEQKLKDKLASAKEARRAETKERASREEKLRTERAAKEEEERAAREEQERLETEAAEAEAVEKAAIEERARRAEEEANAARAAATANREAERAADREKIQAQQKREEEALARQQNRSAAGGPGLSSPTAGGEPRRLLSRETASSAASPLSATGGERRRLQLAPRTIPQQQTPPALHSSATATARPSDREQVSASTQPGAQISALPNRASSGTWQRREGPGERMPVEDAGPRRTGSQRPLGGRDGRDSAPPARDSAPPATGAYRAPGSQSTRGENKGNTSKW